MTDIHTTRRPAGTVRTTGYRQVVPAVLLAAYTLSAVHTVYLWVAGTDDPTFTVTSPAAWAFYAVAFATAALARSEARWAAAVVSVHLVATLAVAVLVYPTIFTPERQDLFGWFENDAYVGLLTTALVLSVLRWRRTILAPAGGTGS